MIIAFQESPNFRNLQWIQKGFVFIELIIIQKRVASCSIGSRCQIGGRLNGSEETPCLVIATRLLGATGCGHYQQKER
jgi:hypothetical protein